VSLFNKNLALLKSTQPSLAKRVEKEPKYGSVRVTLAKDGNPIPQIGSISLHSNYYPLKEASQCISGFEVNERQSPVVYGLGFGYHILEILNKYPEKEILVIEPLMPLFRVFMETMDIKLFLPKTKFIIDEFPPKILACYQSKNWNIYLHLASKQISNDYYECMDKSREAAELILSNSLKILVVNPYYGGSLPTAQYCVQALKSMGHHAEPVECDKFAETYLSLDKITANINNTKLLSQQFNSFMGQVIAAKAADFQPDMVLALAQAPLSPNAIKNLQSLKVPIAFWFVEDFKTLTYWKDIASSYDYFFTIQRGEIFEELKSLGLNNYYYLPQACLPDLHRTIPLSPKEKRQFSANISFMGAGYYNRTQSFPRLLQHDFKIWGTEWNLESPLGSRVQNKNKRISSETIVKIYNAGKININLHSSTYHLGVNPKGDFVNPRTFEIAACGGFQLVDDRTELVELMIPGSEVATFCSIDELCEKVDYYLKNEDEAKSIATMGKIRVLKEHTFQHRMREMLIHIFRNSLSKLKERIDDKFRDPVNYCIDQAGASSNLGKYLEQYRGKTNFSIDTMIDNIENGKGDLNKEELLILMVDQLVKPESR